MLNIVDINKLIFLDIETVPQYPNYKEMPQNWQELFRSRFKKDFEDKIHDNQPFAVSEEICEEIYHNKASLFPEFGKIVCISIGWVDKDSVGKKELVFKTKSFADENEKLLLNTFLEATRSVLKNSLNPSRTFVAYNGFIFDFPFLAKRFILNDITLPPLFDYAERKPWEVNGLLDPKSIWKYNVFDHNTSLDLLANCFGIESSKTDMCGVDVKDVFYVEKDLPKIVKYCEADVMVLAQVVLKMKQMDNVIV